MKKYTLLLALAICLGANAQLKFNTGNADFDKELVTTNDLAKKNLENFKNDLLNQYKVPLSQINDILKRVSEPAEVQLVLEMNRITKQPVDRVLRSYDANKSKGWGAIAKDLGIKPGSKEFHEMKANMGKKEKHHDKKHDEKHKDHGSKKKK